VITYLPSKMLAKALPKRKVEKLLNRNLTINKAVLNTLADSDILTKGTMQKIALKVKKQYNKKYVDLRDDNVPATEAKEDAINDNKLLVQRVQNEAVLEISQEIEDQYSGEFYIWLPSDAETPDPEHQLRYSKKYQIGKDEMPGERIGCRCGMEILVEEKKLAL